MELPGEKPGFRYLGCILPMCRELRVGSTYVLYYAVLHSGNITIFY